MKIKQLLGLILLWCIDECYGQGITIVNNCTCKTFDGGIYSLMPLRRTDGKPRFLIAGKKYPGWRYTYNPCTPVNVGEHDPDADPHKICRDVAICKYAEIEKPREYFEVGLQKDIMCDINQEGQIELVYKTNDPSIDNPHSRVVFLCDESATEPDFETVDEDNYIFSIKHYCACRNRCPALYKSTSVSSSGSMGAEVQLKTSTTDHKNGTGTTLAVMGVAIGAIAAALIGVVVWRKFQARGESQEAQQLMDSCEI
ncbi:uncharacterized protein [Pocillopora verrucosa]|uniref:uncharacterized protein n=1 Tax=Pocillopora verrucosa TaxID=203993 RepID=UPI00333F9C4B